MAWKVEYTDIAEKQIGKLDREIAIRVIRYFGQRVASSPDPYALAEPLQGELKGLWRFRIGDYRALCDIQGSQLIVLVLEIGHRREIYR